MCIANFICLNFENTLHENWSFGRLWAADLPTEPTSGQPAIYMADFDDEQCEAQRFPAIDRGVLFFANH